MEITFKPIGHLQSVFKFKNGTPRQPTVCPDARGKLTIDKSLYNNPEHSLESLEKFSHVWIIFIFHKNNNSYSKAKVKPPRLNGERVGLFSTRSPYRPNPIGLTLAKLEHIEGATLYLSSIDILDGTPVLDIKPYIPNYDNPEYGVHNSQTEHVNMPDGIASEDQQCDSVQPMNGPVDRNVSYQQDHAKRKYDENVLDSTVLDERTAKCACDNEIQSLSENNNRENLTSFVEHGENKSDIHRMTIPCFANFSSQTDSLDSMDEASSDIDENSNVGKRCIFPLNRLIGNTSKTGLKNLRKDGQLESVKSADSQCFSSFKRGFPESSNEVQTSQSDFRICDSNFQASSAASDNRAGSSGGSSVANWVQNAPIGNLSVVFTPRALEQLGKFNKNSENENYRLSLFNTANEAMKAISCILKEDPRSIYRRNQCQDRLYFFSVDTIHVTCWFDENLVEIVRIKPLSQVEQ